MDQFRLLRQQQPFSSCARKAVRRITVQIHPSRVVQALCPNHSAVSSSAAWIILQLKYMDFTKWLLPCWAGNQKWHVYKSNVGIIFGSSKDTQLLSEALMAKSVRPGLYGDHGPVPLLVTLRNMSLMLLDPTSVFGFSLLVSLCLTWQYHLPTYPVWTHYKSFSLKLTANKKSKAFASFAQRDERVRENSPHKMKLR